MTQDTPGARPHIITPQAAHDLPNLAAVICQAFKRPGATPSLYRITLSLRTTRLTSLAADTYNPGRAIVLDLPVNATASNLAEVLRGAAGALEAMHEDEQKLSTAQPQASNDNSPIEQPQALTVSS